MRMACVLCRIEWDKPIPNCINDKALLSHGICADCQPLYDRVVAGERSLAFSIKEAKENRLSMRVRHSEDGLFH